MAEVHRDGTEVLAPAASKVVLVVDDDAEVRDLLAHVLEQAGFRTVTAGDGEEVGDLVRRERPALILLDVILPGADGYTTLARLSGDPDTRDIPVVTITGYGAPIYRTVSAGMGAREHLSKPFSPRQLLATVRGILEPPLAQPG
jgi:two-component system phosphate regulon response regulator PhoB